MKTLLFAFATTASLMLAVPAFACDGHAKSDKKDETTTASAETCGCETCASDKDCATCTTCSDKAKAKADAKKDSKT